VSRQTSYFVQTFDAATGDQLKAGAPIACRTAEGALRTAERLALSKTGALSKGGVVAFSTTSDADTGDYDDQPTVLFRAGDLPAEFDLMP
jgi:hypothetical protein